jgi:hypothetical protein
VGGTQAVGLQWPPQYLFQKHGCYAVARILERVSVLRRVVLDEYLVCQCHCLYLPPQPKPFWVSLAVLRVVHLQVELELSESLRSLWTTGQTVFPSL